MKTHPSPSLWHKTLVPVLAVFTMGTATVEARTPWFLNAPKKVVKKAQSKINATAHRVARIVDDGRPSERRAVQVQLRNTPPTRANRQGQIIYTAPTYAAAVTAPAYAATAQEPMVRTSSYVADPSAPEASGANGPQLVMNGVVYQPTGQPLPPPQPELQPEPQVAPAPTPAPATLNPDALKSVVPNVPERDPVPYARPVPGTNGFVYPPDVEPKPENMVDVRDFRTGQKVRNPKTGEVFLVP